MSRLYDETRRGEDEMPLCRACGSELIDRETGRSKVMMVEVWGVYDGGLFLAHDDEDCLFAWHRWTSPDMRERAQKHLDDWNERRGHTTTL